jgi:predicted acylesterase/phospholipase RssA
VYPLAVCEIASKFRIRNVGGASAGAIAAAATAAAELGRSTEPDADPKDLKPDARRNGHVRRGFVGLADTIGWLTATDPSSKPEARDEHRLAQLFRPGPIDRRVFAVVVAVMRERVWAVPPLVLLAFGNLSRLAVALAVVGGAMVAGWVDARLRSWPEVSRPGDEGLLSAGYGALDLVLFFTAVGALITIVVMLGWVRRARAPEMPPWMGELAGVSSGGIAPTRSRQRTLLGRAGIALLVLALVVATAVPGWWNWVAGALVGGLLSVVLAAIVVLNLWAYLNNAGRHRYGLIAGTAVGRRDWKARTLSERLAGAAKPTVDRSLIPWLSECLTELAGLPPGTVLRFGHLWQGPGFTPRPPRPLRPTPPGEYRNGSETAAQRAAEEEEWRRADDLWKKQTREIRTMAADTTRRLVNLELITTDLSRQRPVRFPLAWHDGDADSDSDDLYFCCDDLIDDKGNGLFPAEVVEALRCCAVRRPAPVHDQPGVRELYRLPEPWNLPVVFAVRLSLALPALFKAVPLYRLRYPATIRDDLGRAILDDKGKRLCWPVEDAMAEKLWFSDGGITSNFPVHLFDRPLPRWPTFGLNLGPYPAAYPHQDVWLPQDWQATTVPAEDLPRSGLGFVSAIVDTARSWRDTAQTGLPGYRGRVAWVRQRPDEGGTNLFMPREVIASLALRGALAGARLSRRFGNTTQWDRYRWMRLRIALANLTDLRHDLRLSRPDYSTLLERQSNDFLPAIRGTFAYDPFTDDDVPWYTPEADRWGDAVDLLDNLISTATPPPYDPAQRAAALNRDKALTDRIPSPLPALRQVPPI